MWSIPLSGMGSYFSSRAGRSRSLPAAAVEELLQRQERLLLERLQEELRPPFVVSRKRWPSDLARHEKDAGFGVLQLLELLATCSRCSEHDVEHRHVEGRAADRRQGLFPRRDRLDLVSPLFQKIFNDVEHSWLVVHHEDSPLGHRSEYSPREGVFKKKSGTAPRR
jgi:hypothetical protein